MASRSRPKKANCRSKPFGFRPERLVLALQFPPLPLRHDTLVVQLFQPFEGLLDQPRLREGLQQIQLDRSQLQAVDLGQHLALRDLLAGLDEDAADAALDLRRRKGLLIGGQFDGTMGDRDDALRASLRPAPVLCRRRAPCARCPAARPAGSCRRRRPGRPGKTPSSTSTWPFSVRPSFTGDSRTCPASAGPARSCPCGCE